MTVSPSILFVIAQPGAAAYFAPLWQLWSVDPSAPDWHLLIDPVSRRHVAAFDIDERRITDLRMVTGDGAENVMAGRDAATVVTSTSFHALERACLRWAVRSGRRAVQLIDAHYSYRQRIVDTNGPDLLPDAILLPDSIAAAEAASDGLPVERLRPLGYPLWEDVAAAPPADERRALFVSQPISSDHGTELGYTERSALALALQLATAEEGGFDEILLARHPREAKDDMPVHDRLHLVSSAGEGLLQAGTILGIYSSFLVEAVLAGRRTISLQPGAVGHDMCVLSRHGVIAKVGDAAGLRRAVQAPLVAPVAFRQAYAGSLQRLDSYLRSTDR